MLLSVSSLGQKYGSAIALEEINFDVSAGSCLCILGRNGAGKTTLLRTLMGIMPPKKGTIISTDDSTKILLEEGSQQFQSQKLQMNNTFHLPNGGSCKRSLPRESALAAHLKANSQTQ